MYKDRIWEIDEQLYKEESYGCSCGFFATKHIVFDLVPVGEEWRED